MRFEELSEGTKESIFKLAMREIKEVYKSLNKGEATIFDAIQYNKNCIVILEYNIIICWYNIIV